MKILSIVFCLSVIPGCKNPIRLWNIPCNEKTMVRLVALEGEALSELARKNSEGAIRIRIIIWTKNANRAIGRIKDQYDLKWYNSSKLTANNLASSQANGAMRIDGEWIPKSYYLVDGFVGDGVSLARYDFVSQEKTILILYSRSESLLNERHAPSKQSELNSPINSESNANPLKESGQLLDD